MEFKWLMIEPGAADDYRTRRALFAYGKWRVVVEYPAITDGYKKGGVWDNLSIFSLHNLAIEGFRRDVPFQEWIPE